MSCLACLRSRLSVPFSVVLGCASLHLDKATADERPAFFAGLVDQAVERLLETRPPCSLPKDGRKSGGFGVGSSNQRPACFSTSMKFFGVQVGVPQHSAHARRRCGDDLALALFFTGATWWPGIANWKLANSKRVVGGGSGCPALPSVCCVHSVVAYQVVRPCLLIEDCRHGPAHW